METDPEQENIPPSLCTTVSDNISDFYEKSTALDISQNHQNEISISLKSLPSIFSSSVKNVNNYQNSINLAGGDNQNTNFSIEKLSITEERLLLYL